jgi:hypothetical protein
MATGRKKKPPVKEADLHGYKYFKRFITTLERFHLIKAHHNRDLHYDQYIALILFYFFNPVLTSLRAIQQASTLEKVQSVLGVKATSLGSLSEASQVFDPQLLVPLLQQLAQQASAIEKDPLLKDIQQSIIAVDGSLLPAVPRMLWALWVDDQHRAAKLHLEFDVRSQMPRAATITDGNGNEKKVLRQLLSPDKFYILDAGYAQYSLLSDIIGADSSVVVRLKDNASWDSIEQRPLTEADTSAGVTRDTVVHLGSKKTKPDCPTPLRIIEIFHKGDSSVPRKPRVASKKTFRTTDPDYSMLLATNRMDLSAETVAALYRYRWQVELFFRWFKCILGCKHLLAHSLNGLTIQVYCALLASMLITLWTGKKPTKRTFEMLSLYFLGWASEQELVGHIETLNPIAPPQQIPCAV